MRPALVQSRRGRSWLLTGTALAGGVLAVVVVGPRPALALPLPCQQSPANTWTCTGPDSSTEFFNSFSGNFTFNLGGDILSVYTPYKQTAPSLGPAFHIDFSEDGGVVNVLHDSFIHNTDTGSSSFGLSLTTTVSHDVTVNVNSASGGSLAADIFGGEDGIFADQTSGIGGSITIFNYGHVEGEDGAGVEVTGGLSADIHNHSYASMIGGNNGAFVHNMPQVNYDNTGGLTAGLNNDGVHINNIFGGSALNDVIVTNGQGGVIAGRNHGIGIFSITGGSNEDGVSVDNSGTKAGGVGGLIVGKFESGVAIENTNGAVTVNNSYTQQGSIDLTKLDPLVYNAGESSGLLFDSGTPVLPPGFTTGIWGNQNGVFIGNVRSDLNILNVQGRIVGHNEEGISLGIFDTSIRGNVFIDNHGVSGKPGGLVWGGRDGIGIGEFDNGFVSGNVTIDNQLGTIYGAGHGLVAIGSATGNGIYMQNVDGNVDIFNSGGLTFGYHSDGMELANIFGTTSIKNGGGPEGELGIVLGFASAVKTSVQNLDIHNGSRGAFLGNGGSFFNPVLLLDTNGSEGGGASVYNAGLVSSYQLPTFDVTGASFTPPKVPTVTLNYDKIFSDKNDIAQFAATGGAAGSIANLGLYAQAAGLNMIVSESGGVSVLNDTSGLLIGRVMLFGSTNNAVRQTTDLTGNTIVNLGTWFTADAAGVIPAFAGGGNTLGGAGETNSIYNLGLIQTAFEGPGATGGAKDETATFYLNDFFNGGVPVSTKVSGGSGLLSMIDGAPGDETYIRGNYHGASKPGFNALLGVDVFFGQGEAGASDLLNIEPQSVPAGSAPTSGGNMYGSTGIIVHKVNSAPGGINQDGIVVVNGAVDANPASMQCFGKPCVAGDTFFISSLSPDYINVNGIPAIQDGLFAWYLTEVGDPHFVLKSTFNPVDGQTPDLITGAQNIWYDASGIVEDHIYGNHFPTVGGGGGGADLAEEPAASAPGEAAGNRSGLWARMSGNWDNRHTSLTDSIFGTIDTSFNQSTFEVLGGGDFSPGGLTGPFRLGIFGGYTTSSLDFASFNTSADYKGGVLGAYAAYTNGGYYADAQVTWDPLSMTFHTAFANVGSNANSVGVIANTGYRMDRGRFFVEPIASLTYVDTRLDDMTTGGGTVDFSNGQSLRAGAGGRVGTHFASMGGTTTEVALLGKLWNEFESANKVTVSDGMGHSVTYSNNISGVFGEAMASATIYSPDRSVSGFLAGGAQFGADFTNWEAKAGVRKTF